MGVTFIAPQGTYTSPAKLITKTITENDTYNAIDDNANGYSSVVVNVEGGGGSSDFSTAEVTVVSNVDPLMIPLPVIVEAELEYPAVLSIIVPLFPDTYTVPLYKGRLEVSGDSNWTVNCTGNIEYSDNLFIITGDGTITISAGE